MNTSVVREFESRDALEVAYRSGELTAAETYRVNNSRFEYRLSTVRKGLIEIPIPLKEHDHE